ncbi:hypothetical protein C8Q74DRAFT_1200735 [Fomes fomentarius]|nr:hypothetical protein C8Q74DRAFT_1200735 [Fomes fomentarius]
MSAKCVCHSFAQKGACRFGDRCRFAHVAGAPISNKVWSAKKKTVQTTHSLPNASTTPNHIIQFFAEYPKFPFDSDASFIKEFYRMCDYFDWGRKSNQREDARNRMRHAMVLQFNTTFGTNAEDLITWQNLCDVISIRPIPETLHACRRAVVTSHINICDLLDAPFHKTPPTRFPSEVALSRYTQDTGKFFPRDDIAAGSLLQYLLRHILNPRSK